MAPKKNDNGMKTKVNEVFNQAKASLKLLENLEKETLVKAKDASLKKMGVASEQDLDELRARLERLEQEVAALRARTPSSAQD
ncbi:MAG: phasin family protein [Oligoflexia bacterium]|nr:phasin family protein [Oligoflexia bacterium]